MKSAVGTSTDRRSLVGEALPWLTGVREPSDQGAELPGLEDQLLHLLRPRHVGGISGHHGAVQVTGTQAAPLRDLQSLCEIPCPAPPNGRSTRPRATPGAVAAVAAGAGGASAGPPACARCPAGASDRHAASSPECLPPFPHEEMPLESRKQVWVSENGQYSAEDSHRKAL